MGHKAGTAQFYSYTTHTHTHTHTHPPPPTHTHTHKHRTAYSTPFQGSTATSRKNILEDWMRLLKFQIASWQIDIHNVLRRVKHCKHIGCHLKVHILPPWITWKHFWKEDMRRLGRALVEGFCNLLNWKSPLPSQVCLHFSESHYIII